MKATLTINSPSNCLQCPLLIHNYSDVKRCLITKIPMITPVQIGRPDHCPLQIEGEAK